jgi:hypothetical protein
MTTRIRNEEGDERELRPTEQMPDDDANSSGRFVDEEFQPYPKDHRPGDG